MPPRAPLILLALLTSVAVSACGRGGAQDPRLEAPKVQVMAARSGADDAPSFSGIVSARVQSDLGFRVAGKIVERLVDTGQTVRRGQPLMRIDPTDYSLALNAQTHTVAAAQAKATQTAADEARYRDLVAAGAVSASTYDQIKEAADAAKAELAAAQAQAKVAQNQTGYAVLLADSDGVVVETLAEPGQVVTAGQTVVKLAHAGPREAVVNLPETTRPAIGSTAAASLFGRPDASGPARLRQLSDAADPATRTFEARYVLEGGAASAPLGATVTVKLAEGGSAAGAVQAPLSAIYDPGSGPGVWVIDGKTSKVAFRPVRLGVVGEETATVLSGLQPGERFVAMGAHLLRAGEQVRVEASATAAP